MKRKHWLLIAVAVIVVALILVNLRARRERGLAVQVEEVTRRDISMVISASGSIRPKRQVDVSASSMGRITRVAVEEGQRVEKGQFLLQIDPVQLESAMLQIRASLEAAKANERQAYAQLEQAGNDLERTLALYEQGWRTDQEVDAAKAAYDIAAANREAALHRIAQMEANLKSARHNLEEVTIEAAMDGIITRLNVEEGESAIMGTTNIPGTVLMTIADLSTIETEVEVDETEVVHIKLGDPAKVTLDAFPDTSYAGRVTEIGNSPILSTGAAGQQGIDFKVVITITDTIPNVRPGLSADTEITVAERADVPSIPIQSLTVRREKDLKGREKADSTAAGDPEEGESKEIEGVFVVEGGRAGFRAVEVGISSQKYFEVISGLEEGEKVVSGNYKAIRDLSDGQLVKVSERSDGEK
ncbi:MAG TPA: efflux RND transporter periplasmic adaptor subunit [Candidatus Eisenbacteria bacterium]|uniref:Efflux RND transporter periplasmic adaptor subunit n=1 Tax=Eiseniibacteriota bacterium TaxID=2212470 RepID=A0A7V2AVE8_UNCEI|nr:efflux RND transporter periplasmic adaptor subunit [Candidatus Eisenbacteria bacterium]